MKHVCWEMAKVNQGQSCSCIFTSAVESGQTCKNHFITGMINLNMLADCPRGAPGPFPVWGVILAFYCDHYSKHQEGNATLPTRASSAPPSLANRLRSRHSVHSLQMLASKRHRFSHAAIPSVCVSLSTVSTCCSASRE